MIIISGNGIAILKYYMTHISCTFLFINQNEKPVAPLTTFPREYYISVGNSLINKFISKKVVQKNQIGELK